MYQDPLGQSLLAARIRQEYGAMKVELINRGLSPVAADRAASLYVSDRSQEWSKLFGQQTQDWATSQGPGLLRQSLRMESADASQRISAERQDWLSRIPSTLSDIDLPADVGKVSATKLQELLRANAGQVEAARLETEGVLPAGSESPVAVPEVIAEQSPMEAPVALEAVSPEGGVSNLALDTMDAQFDASRSRTAIPPSQEAVLQARGTEPVTAQKSAGGGDSMSWGAALAVMGAAQQIVGQFYALKSQQTQLKQQALSLEFQSRMSQINARGAERQAADMIAAGRQQAMELTMRAGQVREGAKATMGARGVRANVGSGAETLASIELMKEVDRFTIDANAVRAANAARMQGVNAANEGLLAGTSAYSLRMQAGALNPVAGAMPSLLTAAGQYYSQRAADRRWAAWAASQGLGE
jgi:hypothetical protein